MPEGSFTPYFLLVKISKNPVFFRPEIVRNSAKDRKLRKIDLNLSIDAVFDAEYGFGLRIERKWIQNRFITEKQSFQAYKIEKWS